MFASFVFHCRRAVSVNNSDHGKVSLFHRGITNFNTITIKIKNCHVVTETSDQLMADLNLE